MAKISGKIYEWCAFKMDTFIDNDDCDELRALADRIDSEMVELPRDAGGVPIHIGDKMYDPLGHYWWKVHSLHLYDEGCSAWRVNTDKSPRDLTHTAPDSWECIADELDAWCNSVDVDGDACDKPRDLAERIRKLAKEQGDE